MPDFVLCEGAVQGERELGGNTSPCVCVKTIQGGIHGHVQTCLAQEKAWGSLG